MSEELSQTEHNTKQEPSPFADPVATILEANGLGERAAMTPSQVVECAKDAGDNRLLMAEVGTRRFFLTLSPALKGRLVGEDRIDDEEVRLHFEVNIIGSLLKK